MPRSYPTYRTVIRALSNRGCRILGVVSCAVSSRVQMYLRIRSGAWNNLALGRAPLCRAGGHCKFHKPAGVACERPSRRYQLGWSKAAGMVRDLFASAADYCYAKSIDGLGDCRERASERSSAQACRKSPSHSTSRAAAPVYGRQADKQTPRRSASGSGGLGAWVVVQVEKRRFYACFNRTWFDAQQPRAARHVRCI
jgi:hypothetical protein